LERDLVKAARKEKFDKHLEEAIGLRKVIDLISQEKKVVVGHNVFQDLVFIWSQFYAALPDTLEEFCRDIPSLFATYRPPFSIVLRVVCLIPSIFLGCILCVGI